MKTAAEIGTEIHLAVEKELDRERIREELREVNGQINDLYWLFTRTARGKPPYLVKPELYRRRLELEGELAATYR